MIRGLMVVRGDGTLTYSYPRESMSVDYQLLLSGFLAALQMFAKNMSSTGSSEMRSMTVSTTLYTFRNLMIHGPAGELLDYNFILLSGTDSKEISEVEDILELLIASFLGYGHGEFIAKLRISDDSSMRSFESFDEVMSDLLKMGWDKAKKRIKPSPSSVMQGVLNDLRNYLPLAQILSLHPKISRIGASYVWVPDYMTTEEEKSLGMAVEQALARLFGPGMYGSILADIEKEFSGR